MAPEVERLLARWAAAGVLDESTAARIRAYELERARASPLRWPVLLALVFGALLLGAGVLLFVSAHWDALSPASRFTTVLLGIAVFHVGGACAAGRYPGTAAALHALGTVALGAGIFLAGQIFHLDERWPAGVMLWAVGAGAGWALLRDVPQLALLAVLAPAWLVGEWQVAADGLPDGRTAHVAACGVFLLALVYFTAVRDDSTGRGRQVLFRLGAAALPGAALLLAVVAAPGVFSSRAEPRPEFAPMLAAGWIVALGTPLVLGLWLHGRAAWPHAVAALWAVALVNLRTAAGGLALYGWWAAGGAALVAWGVQERREERINMGGAVFAATVGAFYFSEVMDKLERSASLVGLGALCLAGGWALERVRRRLLARARGGAS